MKPTTVTTVLGEEITLTDKMWFVVCTDEFLSGWGCAEGKTAKRVCVCKDHQEAEKLFGRMFANRSRHMLSHMYTTPEFPNLPSSKYTISIDKYSDGIYC